MRITLTFETFWMGISRMKKSGSIVCALGWILASAGGVAPDPYRTIRDVRLIKPDSAAVGHRVDIESQIVAVNERNGGFFLYDGKHGIYVLNALQPGDTCPLKPGNRVRVTGTADPGEFAPRIIADAVEVLGDAPLPAAKTFRSIYLYSPQSDCDWVALDGRLISYEVIAASQANILVEMIRNEQIVHIQLPKTPANIGRLPELMFKWVEFNAVAGTISNEHQQYVRRVFYVSSANDFRVVGAQESPSVGDVAGIRPIHELLRFGTAGHRAMVQTYGTVTHVDEHELFLRGEEASLKVWMQEVPDISVGDRVEVTGLTWPQEFGPAFRASAARVVGKADEPRPVRIEATEDVFESLNYDLAEMDTQVLEIGQSFGLASDHTVSGNRITLLCRFGGGLIEAKLPYGVDVPDGVKAGAMVRMSGLCHVFKDDWRPWRRDRKGFWLQLRSPADIAVLKKAPWWTTARLLWVCGIALGSSMLFLAWVVLLRKTVEKQTSIIGAQIERETVLDERQRIARELHDNLEQGLAGAIFQLGGCRRLQEMGLEKQSGLIQEALKCGDPDALKELICQLATGLSADAERNREALEVVGGMLKYCSDESRLSILDLRGGLLETMDLISAVRLTLEEVEEERGVVCELSVRGEPRRLQHAVERNLLLLVKEAVSNAVRHARPGKIGVSLDYTDGLTVAVSDDGCGFHVERGGKYGHFGLQGMQERMHRISGTLDIESAVGSGTVVTARLDSAAVMEDG